MDSGGGGGGGSGGGGGLPTAGMFSQLEEIEKMEQHTHIIQASTTDRRVVVLYLNEIYDECTAELKQAEANRHNQITVVMHRTGGGPHSNSLVAEIVNEVPLAGRAQFIDFTANGMFSFITLTRLGSEKNSYARAKVMCQLLEKDPTDPFLTPYAAACGQEGPQKPRALSILDFVQVASFCPPGSYCPSMLDYNISKMPDGHYSNYGFDQISCEPGTFCPQGIQQKCPIGFTCPISTMKTPQPCRIDKTHSTSCFETGLIAPVPCEEGKICYTPYMPGK
jgi:hypothetical protein